MRAGGADGVKIALYPLAPMGAGLAHDPGPHLYTFAPEARYLGVSAAGPGRARVCRKRYAGSLARHIVPYSQWEGASIRTFCLRNLFVRE